MCSRAAFFSIPGVLLLFLYLFGVIFLLPSVVYFALVIFFLFNYPFIWLLFLLVFHLSLSQEFLETASLSSIMCTSSGWRVIINIISKRPLGWSCFWSRFWHDTGRVISLCSKKLTNDVFRIFGESFSSIFR